MRCNHILSGFSGFTLPHWKEKMKNELTSCREPVDDNDENTDDYNYHPGGTRRFKYVISFILSATDKLSYLSPYYLRGKARGTYKTI